MASLFVIITLGGEDAHLRDEENETIRNEESTRNRQIKPVKIA